VNVAEMAGCPREMGPVGTYPAEVDPEGICHQGICAGGIGPAGIYAAGICPPLVYPTEDGAVIPPTAVGGLHALFTGHILRDGEIVLLILKPSLWFILLQSARFSMIVGVFALGAALLNGHVEYRDRFYFEIALVVITIRLMWTVLQWQGRLYVLTDQRIIRLAGVFSTDVFDCMLRKVATVRFTATPPERTLGIGSLEIYPMDEMRPAGLWQTIARPRQVHASVIAAINRAKG